jgi:hypothetical protein
VADQDTVPRIGRCIVQARFFGQSAVISASQSITLASRALARDESMLSVADLRRTRWHQ